MNFVTITLLIAFGICMYFVSKDDNNRRGGII